MKYVDEFRDGATAQRIAERIAAEVRPDRHYSFMEFCGGHTHAIARYGITELLPAGVRMIHGPGCPVCVLPIGRIDQAIHLALERGAIVCTYGDTMRVPASPAAGPPQGGQQGGQHPLGGRERQASRGLQESLSLMKAKARGADIRMVYSAADALKLARENPAREVVFFAIGFETTTPPTALVIQQAAAEQLKNFSVLSCHVLTPSAITHILESAEVREYGTVPIDGFIGPAHVSIVIGSQPYEHFAEEYGKPVVIAGFEPLDVMQAIRMLVRQVNEGRAEVENEFMRAVTREGNRTAQALVAEVFELRERFEWRGLGEVPYSALKIRPAYAEFDAERRFDLTYQGVPDHKQCECGAILRGVKRPTECKLFGTVCTPENPMGSCMVSSEGACAAHYSYGRFRDIQVVAA
ncbi:MAG: hydrogenase formation protein HypD [Rubrivivax sp.]|nr:hydrogenase formation protein HypD [Rubrivivax sp.]